MNNKIILLGTFALTAILLLVASQTGSTNNADNLKAVEQFKNFREEFNKNYSSAAELEYRFFVFSQKLDKIEKHNSNPSKKFKLGINQFSDLTFEEFKARYLSNKVDYEIPEGAKFNKEFVSRSDDNEVNWVKKGVVRGVKDQGECDSDYAFSTIGAIESALQIFLDKKDVRLSEQEIVDCSENQENNKCDGGSIKNSLNYIKEKGINTSEDYPYTASSDECNQDLSGKGQYKILGYNQIKRGVENVVQAVRAQPVSVSFNVGDPFQNYKSGVFDTEDCEEELNHNIVVVGFKLDADTPYFLCKNSWGTRWGERGFFRIAIKTESGTCNFAGHDANHAPVVK